MALQAYSGNLILKPEAPEGLIEVSNSSHTERGRVLHSSIEGIEAGDYVYVSIVASTWIGDLLVVPEKEILAVERNDV